MKRLSRSLALVCLIAVAACGGASTGATSSDTGSASAATPAIKRPGFLGAFFRPVGVPPFGVFSVYSKQTAPEPYPAPSTKLFGPGGYCDTKAANGLSIATGYKVDDAKLANIVQLGVKWTRTPVSADYDDQSHIFGPGKYSWADFDALQCAVVRAKIAPIVGFEAGSVHYNAEPDTYSPKELPTYKTAADFGQWCGVVTEHEKRTFAGVRRYSLPDNEVNSDTKMFPGGDAQIAAYAKACYKAIKAVEPDALVYGFELNMEKDLDPAAFVQRMYALGCKKGTCYDAISLHLYEHYPLPPLTKPCYPNPGGDYTAQCITDVRNATHDPAIHILIGETAFLVPATVPDEATKAKATVELMQVFAADKLIDGVNYANIDECDLYPTGFFFGGCLVSSTGEKLAGYTALQKLATANY